MSRAWFEKNKEHRAKYRRQKYAENRERELECMRRWRKENDDHRKQYATRYYEETREQNAEKNRKRARRWAKENPARVNATVRKRQVAKLQAIPLWAELKKIEAIYAEARRLTEETGIKHHVDHIYPLVSKVMCGLHCETNLQILTAAENCSKSNRHWPTSL
jgi:hypothetical protein